MDKSVRDANFDYALKMMMAELEAFAPLGAAWFTGLSVDGDKSPYDKVLPTTWSKLFRDGLVKDHGLRRYTLTSEGWFYGMELLGLPNNEAFRERMSKLSASLKGYVKAVNREEDVLKDIYAISNDEMPEDFIRNAIASRLLDRVFNLRGAYFPPEDKMQNYLVIPRDYGLDD